MERYGNIVIGDQSALFFYLHNKCDFLKRGPDQQNPLLTCAQTSGDLHAFNCDHRIFGSDPVELLVPHQNLRRHSSAICCHCVNQNFPSSAFYELRPRLHIASPELTYVRMSQRGLPTIRLAEIATNLCGRFYVARSGALMERPSFITTTKKLGTFLDQAKGMRGAKRAREALQFAMDNSGSFVETKMMLQCRLPLYRGGFNLPFTHMNFDVKEESLVKPHRKSSSCISLVDHVRHFGVEYGTLLGDHAASGRRSGELSSLGWTVLPFEMSVLYNAKNTARAISQIAQLMNLRVRRGPDWPDHFRQLRRDLDLPL